MRNGWIDAHCHLDDPRFDADRDAVLERAVAAGVHGHLLAGVDPEGWRRQRALSAARPGIRWAAGVHPWRAAEWKAQQMSAALDALPEAFDGPHPACAVGETGLDARFVPKHTLPQQTVAFRSHLRLAKRLNLPVIVHVVAAHGACLEVLQTEGLPPAGGMVHAFSGSAGLARQYLTLGLHLSLAGPVASARSKTLRAAVPLIPSDRLLIETDAPDQPLPGMARSEPAHLLDVAAAVATLRGESVESVLEQTRENAAALFGF